MTNPDMYEEAANWYRSWKKNLSVEQLDRLAKAAFLTPWVYNGCIKHQGQTYLLWSCDHKDGYQALELTNQKFGNKPPRGSSHYTMGIEAMARSTGIPLEDIKNAYDAQRV